MRELVIVVSDLYLSPEASVRQLPEGVALPGLHHVLRFGSRSDLSDGWRPWLARWRTGEPNEVPSRATDPSREGEGAAQAHLDAVASVAALAAKRAPGAMAWLATPVHLIAGLSSVHLDPRGLLRLEAQDLIALADEFQRVFHDSGFVLEPLDTGDFLLFGPQMHVSEETEPARFLGESVVQRNHASEPALRRLSAEIEMWLHEHPVNEARKRRGQMPVNALWLWGGGPVSPSGAASARDAAASAGACSDIAFGRDAYLQGLWASLGGKVFPLPQQLADVFGYPHARRAVLVIEIGPMLHSAPTLTLLDALVQIDRMFIHPAVEALQSTSLERLVLIANDRQLTVRGRDRFKLWRQAPLGLSGLQ